MSKVTNLLGKGNGKLGENIHTFSIPAWDTCPGRSEACSICYARKGWFRIGRMREMLDRNLEASRADNFADRMIAEIERRWCRVVRIHVSGDFYDPAYASKWVEIAERCPDVTFYCYTRSWRVAEIVPVLEELAALENTRMWYSADDDTGIPERVPCGVRVAYLLRTEDDRGAETVDLVFRDKPLRTTVSRRVGLAMVCPVENGTDADTDCGRCKVCWK